ncbi:MAG: GTPase HflX [Elusimicrobia bacterium]|nr:GTPase HflX [Elusimicrobiota bacterium]
MPLRETLRPLEKVILVGLLTKKTGFDDDSLDELERLVESAGGAAVKKIIQKRMARDPALLIGKGKTEEIAAMVRRLDIHTVVFDEELTPTQQRNLEEAIGTKIIDRTRLILDVFAQRARTKEGILQVELAQSTYMLTRLSGRGAGLSQQLGGIGARGPGERALEYDRRRIRVKIQNIKKQLAGVQQERETQRAQRLAEGIAQAALVGYTNAGKSSLLNKMLGPHQNGSAAAYADDRLFATLDPLTKRIYLPGGLPLLVTDTVGFIRKLPTHLVASFRATLEEIRWADCLIIVDDPMDSESEIQKRRKAVDTILGEFKVDDYPALRLFTKADLLTPDEKRYLAKRYPEHLLVSSKTGEGFDQLMKRIENLLIGTWPKSKLRIRAKDGHLVSLLYKLGRVIEFKTDRQGDYRVYWQAPAAQIKKLQGMAGP